MTGPAVPNQTRTEDEPLPSLLGTRVVLSRVTRWDAIYATPDALIVGEVGHLKHVLVLDGLHRGMREDSRALLDAAWLRITGESRPSKEQR